MLINKREVELVNWIVEYMLMLIVTKPLIVGAFEASVLKRLEAGATNAIRRINKRKFK